MGCYIVKDGCFVYLVLLNHQPLLFDILGRRKYWYDDDLAIFRVFTYDIITCGWFGGVVVRSWVNIAAFFFFGMRWENFNSSATIFAIAVLQERWPKSDGRSAQKKQESKAMRYPIPINFLLPLSRSVLSCQPISPTSRTGSYNGGISDRFSLEIALGFNVLYSTYKRSLEQQGRRRVSILNAGQK